VAAIIFDSNGPGATAFTVREGEGPTPCVSLWA
jgi:hypothetical protein